jgi:hypothetical protein
VVRRRSAKPLFTGSNPVAASIDLKGLDILTETLANKLICSHLLAAIRFFHFVNRRYFGTPLGKILLKVNLDDVKIHY